MTDTRSRPIRRHRLMVGVVCAAVGLGVGRARGDDGPPADDESGPESRIFSPRSSEAERVVLQPVGSFIQRMGPAAVPPPEEGVRRGARVYASTCAACHQAAGQGVAMAFPPLAGSDYLNADQRLAR